MHDYEKYIGQIATQRKRMCELVTAWANMNSGSRNLEGLNQLAERLTSDFAVLEGETSRVALPPPESIDSSGEKIQTRSADALMIRKRPDAPLRVLLCIHMDTVYGIDDLFRAVKVVDEKTLNGPGVADAKGGLCVMLIALEALEKSPLAQRIGWEIIINPDEEIGSPGSMGLLRQAAGRNHLGLIYEPALADGMMVGQRKGSGNFDLIVRGKSAHAGRDFHAGRNAIHAAAAIVGELERIALPEVTVNVGRIDGGGPVNVVPALAVVRLNVRVPTAPMQRNVEDEIGQIVARVGQREGIGIELHGGFSSPPMEMTDARQRLYERVAECGKQLGLSLRWQSSGGASDGNKLAGAGLPVIDTLGPCGGNLHSPQEFLLTDTLTQRAQLSALLLMKIAAGEIPIVPR